MSKELVRSGQKYLANSNDESLRSDTGTALIQAGAGGLVLGGAAWLLPFVTLPMLLVLAVVAGAYLKFK